MRRRLFLSMLLTLLRTLLIPSLFPAAPSTHHPAIVHLPIRPTDDSTTTIRASFNRQTGWLVRYEVNGIDLLDDRYGCTSNFCWPGYNDSASSFARAAVPNAADLNDHS